jgi:hydroxyacylglutathione hydrolase
MTGSAIPIISFDDVKTAGDVTLIDIRTPAEFSRGHIAGSLSVEYSASGFPTRVDLVDSRSERLAVVASSRPRGEAACEQLNAAGRSCVGLVQVTPDMRTEGTPVTQVTEIWATNLYPDFSGEAIVLDVREPIELETGFVPGAICIPLGELTGRTSELPRSKPITVICEAGLRSATAASILLAAGFSTVAHVPDGTAGYRRTGRTLAFPEKGPDDAV